MGEQEQDEEDLILTVGTTKNFGGDDLGLNEHKPVAPARYVLTVPGSEEVIRGTDPRPSGAFFDALLVSEGQDLHLRGAARLWIAARGAE